MKTPLFYARVSRDDLHCENQKITLTEWAVRQGYALDSTNYLQEEETTRKTRPIKEEAINRFRKGLNDGIVVARLDRWARSLQEMVMDVEGIVNNGGRFVSVLNGIECCSEQVQEKLPQPLFIFIKFNFAVLNAFCLAGTVSLAFP